MAMVSFKRGTQAQYDAATKNADTLYFTTDTYRLFLGNYPIAEGERLFDIIQSYESDITTGTMTLVTHGDTTDTLTVGVKGGDRYFSVTGTYDTSKKLTTYTSSNTARTDGVYIFNKNDVALTSSNSGSLLSDIQISKALKILKFDINPSLLNWANIT